MPCFKGIAVSIHANGAPVPEHGLQKQSRFSRISTYIPVPQPTLAPGSTKPEPARFAISITLLTPGLAIPYSTPKPTAACPKPKPQFVGSAPGPTGATKSASGVSPYIPVSSSPNETIAAYIYFDGRAKEEVATLLRPGEETWVNSRWVQVPDSEGGGLAEREFLFREVGLERWLNGLDLKGHDAAEKLQRRRQKFEARRKREDSRQNGGLNGRRDTLRYGADESAPLEAVMDDELSMSDDDDDEPPEATGQIKVAMFRVLASGEIKKGEYSPQFDAHDDDEEGESNQAGVEADVEHTTSFAKPKTLDPSTISTQTVTGLDGPDKPYATFTFFYRGERQLQKIGIIGSKPFPENTVAVKRRSGQLDFGSLGPLKTTGTVGFSAFRDSHTDTSRRRKSRKNDNGTSINDDSDDDDEDSPILDRMDDADDKNPTIISDDPNFGGELTDGVNRIRLKRALSAEPDKSNRSNLAATAAEGPNGTLTAASLSGNAKDIASTLHQDGIGIVGSPLKKHRPSEHPSDMASSLFTASASLASATGMDSVISGSEPTSSDIAHPPVPLSNPAAATHMEEEEEL